jgi:recombination protein RecA
MPRRKRTSGEGEATSKPARAIDAIVQRITNERDADDETGVFTGSDRVAGAKDFISTQSFALDTSLNMPGVPVGRMTYVHGWESGGKTTLITHLIAETQRRGGVAVLIDSEQAFDEARAERIGVNLEDLILMQPETIEASIQAVEKSIKAIRDEVPDDLAMVVWDSVGATPPKAEIEGDFGDSKALGAAAKLVSTAMRRVNPIVKKHNIALVIVNQNREKIETGPFASMGGDQNTQIASHPLRFYASLEIDMRKAQELRVGDKDSPAYGILARSKVAKNKCSNPFGKAELRILFDRGFDDNFAYFQAALRLKLLVKNGSWYAMSQYESKFRESEFGEVLDEMPGLREQIARDFRRMVWPLNVRQRFMSEEDAGDERQPTAVEPVEDNEPPTRDED